MELNKTLYKSELQNNICSNCKILLYLYMHGTIKQASSIELSDKHAPVHSLTRAFTAHIYNQI